MACTQTYTQITVYGYEFNSNPLRKAFCCLLVNRKKISHSWRCLKMTRIRFLFELDPCKPM